MDAAMRRARLRAQRSTLPKAGDLEKLALEAQGELARNQALLMGEG